MKVYTGLTDAATDQDALNVKSYVNGCAEYICSCETPISIAVQGDWGTGKSSFMKMIEDNIKDKVTIVKFNTWQYSRVEDERLFLPMLKELTRVIDEAYEQQNAGQMTAYNKYFKEGGSGTIRFLKNLPMLMSAAGSFGSLYAGGGVGAVFGEALRVVGDRFQEKNGQNDDFDYYEEIVNIRTKLQQRVDVLTGARALLKNDTNGYASPQVKGKYYLSEETGERPGRIVVFIDDLDRLRPASAVGLLEDIKNFMDCEGCVFILALDHKLIQSGVKEKYGDELDDQYARKFFEKIVQIPFNLPVKRYDIQGYVEDLLEKSDMKDMLKAEDCVKTIREYSSGNPRVIKRALNAFHMSVMMESGKIASAESRNRHFALLLLQSVREDLYNELVRVLADKEISACLYFGEQPDIRPSDEWERNHPGEWKELDYIRALYDQDDFLLKEDIFDSMMLEAGHFRSSSDERDKVFELICDYLLLKGMQRYKPENNKTETDKTETAYFRKGQVNIDVKRYEIAGHANVNFSTLKDEPAEAIINEFRQEGAIMEDPAPCDPEKAKHYLFDEHDAKRYMCLDSCLFFSNIGYDRKVLSLIGRIIRTVLKETGEPDSTDGKEQAQES